MKDHLKTILILTLLLLILPVSTAVLITGSSSSFNFYIENCTSPSINTTLDCNPATVTFECDIYPAQFINSVTFRIDGIDYATTQTYGNPVHFYRIYTKPADTTNTLIPITMDRQQITDVNNIKINTYQLIQIPHNCTTCPANYTLTPITSCQTDNTYTLQHTSSNETCSPSYNTTEACNYCDPQIIANYTSCNTNGTRTVSFSDLNYTTCCLTTGLTEDCIINTPQYNTINESCNFYTNQFTCTLDQAPVMNNKININCELPTEDETCCVVNVYQGQNYTNLLQTSPEYKSTSNFFLLPQQQETRTCFSPTQRLLNAYYTKKELRADTEYKLEVKCTNTNTTLISQYQITPVYHLPDWWFQRWTWFANNPAYIFGSLFFLIIFIALGIYLIRQARRR